MALTDKRLAEILLQLRSHRDYLTRLIETLEKTANEGGEGRQTPRRGEKEAA